MAPAVLLVKSPPGGVRGFEFPDIAEQLGSGLFGCHQLGSGVSSDLGPPVADLTVLPTECEERADLGNLPSGPLLPGGRGGDRLVDLDQLGSRAGELVGDVGGATGENSFVFGDLGAQLAVHSERVVAGGKGLRLGSARAAPARTSSAPDRWSARRPPQSPAGRRLTFQVWVSTRARDWPT